MKKKLTFKVVYLIWAGVLAALVLAAVLYVAALLRDYENTQPERYVQDAVAELSAAAENGSFWENYAFPGAETGRFEQDVNVQTAYLDLLTEGDLTPVKKGGLHAEDELYYYVKSGDLPLAEVKLKAAGPIVTKLAVFSMQEWKVEYVKPVIEARDYTLSVPADFRVSVNGIPLTAEDGSAGSKGMSYTVSGLYLLPDVEITDADGTKAGYTIKNGQILPELYNYTLTLPATLTVELNGEKHPGEAMSGGLVRHEIVLLKKPTVKIFDLFGNVVEYEGGSELPMTYKTITAQTDYTVLVKGQAVPAEAVATRVHPDYTGFADYVKKLPQLSVYSIAVLENDAEITVMDAQGKAVALDPEESTCDLTAVKGLDTVPAAVSAEIDVLKVAQNWSLFMSNDIRFAEVSKYLIKGSYQHEVATKYANGIDITFVSNHTLLDPPFTGNTATNYVQITEDCFSVDISFVKHMRLGRTGELVDDPMNDRFYFVRYDDTADGVANPVWKLAGMKEIVNDAGV